MARDATTNDPDDELLLAHVHAVSMNGASVWLSWTMVSMTQGAVSDGRTAPGRPVAVGVGVDVGVGRGTRQPSLWVSFQVGPDPV